MILKNKGFTLFEMIIVVAIISILSAMFFLNYKSGKESMALQRATHKLAQDIRRTQSMAGLSTDGCFVGGVPRYAGYQYGYGILLVNIFKEKYQIFADCDGNKIFSGILTDQVIEEIEFEKGIEIDSFLPAGGGLSIVFVPPDPSVHINNDPSKTESTITIKSKSGSRFIKVYNSGLIEY